MQFSKNKDNQLEIKTKQALILLDDIVKINDVDLEGPGEYEIGEISVDGLDDDVYIIQAEEIPVGIVNFKCKISKESVEKLSNVGLLVAQLDGDIENAIEQVGQIEPNIVFYVGEASSADKLKAGGVTCDTVESIKIQKNDIDTDQKAYFIQASHAECKKS
ncbi:MAG: hypothetical protein NTZ65_02195 [Candidatus Berkelbacteria bacterium]|nr:hypothetical protein [Candidatus Berkelbacteria bacterium]